MIPTQVSKIWLGALALLFLWGISAAMIENKQRAQSALVDSHTSAQNVKSRVDTALRLMSDLENQNESYLATVLSRTTSIESRKKLLTQPRVKFDSTKARFSTEYKIVKGYSESTKIAPTQLDKRFQAHNKKWYKLSNDRIEELRKVSDSLDRSLITKIKAEKPDRAQALDKAREVLSEFQQSVEAHRKVLKKQQDAQKADVSAFTRMRTILGICAIVGLAFLLSRQAGQLSSINESLRREIENRRRAERERQILANHDEQILNSTTEGIVGLNAKGRVTFVNPAAAEMLGWEITELIGKSWHDVAQHSRGDNTRLDKDASPVMATLRDANPRRVSDDTFWKRTGRTFPVEYAVSPLYEMSPREGEEHHLSGATLTFRDITERKRSEIALLRLASVVESSKDAILSHLLDGTIVSCNASAVKMYGYSAREMEGQALAVLFPPSRADEATLLAEHIARGERIEPYQTTLVAKGGERVDVAITFYPVRDARGNIMGASSNARPVRRDARGDLPTFEALRASKSAGSAQPEQARGPVGTAR